MTRSILLVLLLALLSACARTLPEPSGPGTFWGQRFDIYDAQSNRIGSGRITGNSVDVFDSRSNRIGTIRTR